MHCDRGWCIWLVAGRIRRKKWVVVVILITSLTIELKYMMYVLNFAWNEPRELLLVTFKPGITTFNISCSQPSILHFCGPLVLAFSCQTLIKKRVVLLLFIGSIPFEIKTCLRAAVYRPLHYNYHAHYSCNLNKFKYLIA